MTTELPTYVKQLYQSLLADYSVKYYLERTGEYTVEDCFILNGFCVKIDRLPVDELSEENMSLLLNSIRDIYILLSEQWRKYYDPANQVL